MLLSSAKVEVKCYWLSDCIWFLTVPLVINICSVSSSHILEAEMPHFYWYQFGQLVWWCSLCTI